MSCEPKIKEVRKRCKVAQPSSCDYQTNNQCSMSNCNPCAKPAPRCPTGSFCPPAGSINFFTGESSSCSPTGCETDYLIPGQDGQVLTTVYNETTGKSTVQWKTGTGGGGTINADDVVGFCAKVSSCLTTTPITSSQIANGTITNEDVSPSAGIVGSKLDFTSSTPTGFCAAVAACGGGGGGDFTCNDVLACINNAANGSIPASKIGSIPATQITGLCPALTDCLEAVTGFADGNVLTVNGSDIQWVTPAGGSPEVARQPEFFQNLTSGSTVPLSSAPAAGTVLQVFRNGELWHPIGSAPDSTWSISVSTITFSEPFGNSVNGASGERVAVYFIKS